MSPSRRWAVRFALIVACAGSVATSGTQNQFSTSTDFDSPPQSLTAESPKARRHLRLHISAAANVTAQVEVSLNVRLLALWKYEPNHPEPTPYISARMTTYSWGPGYWHVPVPFTAPPSDPSQRTAEIEMSAATTYVECDFKSGCEVSFPLDVELLPEDSTGPVEVSWHVHADADVLYDGKLEGLTLQATVE